MRTTMTLDDDLFAKLKDDAHARGVSFKQAVNDAVRAGLSRDAADVEPYRITPARMGGFEGRNLDKALQLAAELEDEEILAKMRRGA